LTTPEPPRGDGPRELPGLGAFFGLGLTIAVTVGIFVLLGLWADATLKTSPLFLVVGIVLGCASAVATTVVLAKRYL